MTKTWTAREQSVVNRFIREAMPRLRLADWTVTVDFDEPSPSDALASMHPFDGHRHAFMRLGAEFAELTADEQRQTLVHELMHCHLFDIALTAGHIIESLPGSGEQDLASRLFNDRIEWATDTLADAFVPLVADLAVPATPPRAAVPRKKAAVVAKLPTKRTTPAAARSRAPR